MLIPTLLGCLLGAIVAGTIWATTEERDRRALARSHDYGAGRRPSVTCRPAPLRP